MLLIVLTMAKHWLEILPPNVPDTKKLATPAPLPIIVETVDELEARPPPTRLLVVYHQGRHCFWEQRSLCHLLQGGSLLQMISWSAGRSPWMIHCNLSAKGDKVGKCAAAGISAPHSFQSSTVKQIQFLAGSQSPHSRSFSLNQYIYRIQLPCTGQSCGHCWRNLQPCSLLSWHHQCLQRKSQPCLSIKSHHDWCLSCGRLNRTVSYIWIGWDHATICIQGIQFGPWHYHQL